VLDLTATDEALGKPSGQDLLEGVYTLPVIFALRDNPELRDRLGRPLDREELAEARHIASSNGAVDAALSVARTHAAKAIDALSGADALDPRVSGALSTLVERQVTRET
jgi:heptaprenyl diphosphate synthase